jgi:hypothetical protein
MSEKIVIDLDDIHEEHPGSENSNGRIVVEIPEEQKREDARIEIEAIEESYESKIRQSRIDFQYRGNPGLCNYFETQLRFPEGIDRGFGSKFQMQLKDEFLSSLLVNNKFVIAASRSGNVYFADRFDGVFCEKLYFPGQTFEKTGLVHNNIVYVSTPQKIYRISDKDDLNYDEVYSLPEGCYIWSSLNRRGNHIIFAEFSPSQRTGRIVAFDIRNGNTTATADISDFAGDQICIAGSTAYSANRNKIALMNLDTLAGTVHEMNIECGEAPFLFHLNNRLYVTTIANEVYYLDLPAANYNFRIAGIRNTFMNSIAAFGDNVFIGTQEGWKYYKSSGLQIYSFDDEYENRIEAVCRSLIIVSQKNKIVFGNLSRFQEAESFVVSATDSALSTEIISAVISYNDIYTLTSNGILSAFTNDKMNIHI